MIMFIHLEKLCQIKRKKIVNSDILTLDASNLACYLF